MIRFSAIKTTITSKFVMFYIIFFTHGSCFGGIPVNNGNLAIYFPVALMEKFYLYSDSVDANIVYYAPKFGTIKLLQKPSGEVSPLFYVTNYIPTDGFFRGVNVLSIAGAFDTKGFDIDLTQLNDAALQAGLTIVPAPVTSAKVQFLLSGFEVSADGRVDASCEFTQFTTPFGSVEVPLCKAIDSSGQLTPVEFMYQFKTRLPTYKATIGQAVPFLGYTIPGWEGVISNYLQTGASWDANIQALVTWNIETIPSKTIAIADVNWVTLFENARYYLSAKSWVATQSEVSNFWMNNIFSNSTSGVQINYIDAIGNQSASPPDDQTRLYVNNYLAEKLTEELFSPFYQKIRFPNPLPHMFYSLKSNYVKLTTSKTDTIPVVRNAGNFLQPRTSLGILCLTGGFGAPVTWLNSDPACAAFLAGGPF